MFNNAKETVVKTFDSAAQEYDTIGTSFFRYYGKKLAELANVSDSDCVLDIACGKGAVTFPVAEKIGEKGNVFGIDISSKMIDQCIMQMEGSSVRNVKFMVMDATQLDFADESFDKVICGFALFFLPDIEKGLKEIRRVLKKGGTIIFSSWNRAYQLGWMYELIRKYVPVKIPVAQSEGGIVESDFGTIAGLEKVLSKSGFQKEQILTENLDCYYGNKDELISTYWHTAFRMFFDQMSEGDYSRFKEEVLMNLENYWEGGRIKIVRSAFMTKATLLP